MNQENEIKPLKYPFDFEYLNIAIFHLTCQTLCGIHYDCRIFDLVARS